MSDRATWIALKWCHVALRQSERVRASWTEAVTARDAFLGTPGIRRVFAEDAQPMDLFWGDVQFLMVSVRHLRLALKLDPTGPQLPEPLGSHAETLRHLLEHWQGAAAGSGAWKGLQDKHGEWATPTQVMADLTDLRVGPEGLSVTLIEVAVQEVLEALTVQVGAEPDRPPRTRVWVAGPSDQLEELNYLPPRQDR